MVMKSGSNSLHGTAFEYLRNEDLDANTFFNNEQGIGRQILKRNQYGATVGGPVWLPDRMDGLHKVFVFFAYEGQRQSANAQSGKITTFTPLEAQGNFSKSVNGGPDPAVTDFLLANPWFQGSPTLASQAIVDPNRISKVSLNYFKNGLLTTSPSGYLFPEATATANHSEYLGKVDYTIGIHDMLSATLAAQDSPNVIPFSGSQGATTVTGYPVSTGVAAYFGNVGYTHSFLPASINIPLFTAHRINEQQHFPIGTQPGPAALGIGITPALLHGPTSVSLSGRSL